MKGKRVIILVEDMYNALESWYRYYRLKEAGAEVVVVGSGSAEEYTGKAGIPRRPDTTAEQVSAADCDGIVIPGGYAPDHMRRHPAMVKLVKDLFDAGKVMAAICHAGWMLAPAEIVKGRTVTSFFAIKARNRKINYPQCPTWLCGDQDSKNAIESGKSGHWNIRLARNVYHG